MQKIDPADIEKYLKETPEITYEMLLAKYNISEDDLDAALDEYVGIEIKR